MKKIWKSWFKNQISYSLIHGFSINFFDLKPSHIHIHANPIQNGLQAAPEIPKQTWNFSRKTQIWKPSSRSIQAKRLIPSPSWGFKEGIRIKTISFDTKKRENAGVLYRKFFVFLHHDSCIFHNFWCLIYVPYAILKLTVWFDFVFVHHRRIHHCYHLGFFKF